MKKVTLTIVALLCFASTASATSIEMQPGAQITVYANDTTTVSCSGESSSTNSLCSLDKKSSSSNTCVKFGDVEIQCFYHAKDALAKIIAMKKEGICNQNIAF